MPPKDRPQGALAGSTCAPLSADSLKCIEANYEDKSKCTPFFLAYKQCKAEEYAAARAARIRANNGCACRRCSRPAPVRLARTCRSLTSRVRALFVCSQ